MRPSIAPDLKFGPEDQQSAYDELGANCGPGALAGVCGITPRQAIALMPEFHRRKATTETMISAVLTSLGRRWKIKDAGLVRYGICRVQWDGPWMRDPDPYEKLRHSHWVGICRTDSEEAVFDINAIGQGGWLPFGEWSCYLAPWLLEGFEPQATGGWAFSEGFEISLPLDA